MRVETLPKNIQELLCDEECRQYLSFSSGDSFEISGVYSYDEKRLLYGLPKEYSRLGTTLVDAIWFCHPVKLLLVWEQELYWSEADVYKCHIAGPLFTDNLLRIRAKDPEGDIASSWELHAGIWKKTDMACFQEEIVKARSEVDGSVLEEIHLDLKLRK